MGFSREEGWSGLPFPPPGDLSDPGVRLTSLVSPALQADTLPTDSSHSSPRNKAPFPSVLHSSPFPHHWFRASNTKGFTGHSINILTPSYKANGNGMEDDYLSGLKALDSNKKTIINCHWVIFNIHLFMGLTSD